MTQPQQGYTVNDLLIMLGQATVELAFLRARIAQLEQQLVAEQAPNGVIDKAGEPSIVG